MTYPQTGDLYAHRHKPDHVFMILTNERFSVTIRNVGLGKDFEVPIDNFMRWWMPLGGTHE